MDIQKMILHKRPPRTVYDILSLTNSTPLTADTILWCKKTPVSIDDFYFLFHRIKYVGQSKSSRNYSD